jgi:hypothetical protein
MEVSSGKGGWMLTLMETDFTRENAKIRSEALWFVVDLRLWFVVDLQGLVDTIIVAVPGSLPLPD